jgi:hypothetical protein
VRSANSLYLAAFAAASLALPAGVVHAAAQFKLVTATEGVDFDLGRDLARFVAPAADIQLGVLAKWREVEPKLDPLPPGMSYYQPTTTELHDCPVARPPRQRP